MIYVVGGAPLNFKVVGGTSTPTSPKENTIWVNTDTEITSWIFSATQPAGSEGMVWFTTSTSSAIPFNALKKNRITVYPVSAKQYVSGAWVAKPVSIYQSGAWKTAQLIIAPNTATVWTKSAGTASASKTESGTTISLTAQSSANGTAASSTMYTEFDATSYSTLYIKGTYSCNNTSGGSQEFSIKLLNSSGSTVSTIYSKETSSGSNTSNASISKTIDLSSVTGKCKIQLSAKTWSMSSQKHTTVISDCRAY